MMEMKTAILLNETGIPEWMEDERKGRWRRRGKRKGTMNRV